MKQALRFAAMFAVAVALLAGLSTPASAQEIQKPVHAVGEWCEYEDGFGNIFRQTVTDIAPDGGFTLVGEGETKPREERVYDFNHKLIRRGQNNYSPYWSAPDFPLKVGQSGKLNSFSYAMEKSGVTKASGTLESVTRDEVTVPAGTFAVLVSKVVVEYSRESGRTGQFVVTRWWALDPNIKLPVKQVFLDYRSQKNSWEMSLVKCSGP